MSWKKDSYGIMPLDPEFQSFPEQLLDDDVFKLMNERNKLFENLQKEVKVLKASLEHILQPFWQEIKNEMFDLKNQIKDRDEKIEQLEADRREQNKCIEKIRNDLKTTTEAYENACHNQSACLNRLSSTFGSLLWKASKEPNVVQYFITGNKLSDLVEIVSSSLKSFFDVYADELPNSKSEVKKFIVSFVGIISNIATSIEGRSAIMNSTAGENLIKQLIEKFQSIPIDEIPLQKIFLTTFYNISISTVGLSIIENESLLLERIVNNILSNNELKKISLKLLESITHETSNQNLMDFLQITIPFEELKGNCDETSLKLYELMINIRKNTEYENIEID